MKPRTQSSFAVSDDGIRRCFRPSINGTTRLPAHLDEHGVDHFSGLLTLRESWPLSVLVTQKVVEAIKSAPAFDQVEKLLAGDLAIAQSRRGEAK